MKQKKLLIVGWLVLILTCLVLLVGCSGNQEEAGNEVNNVANEQNQEENLTGPVYGGTLRIVAGIGPNVLGYYPEMNSTDQSWTMPALECLMTISEDRKLEPQLAESMVEDPENKTITFKLREGVKFHDGSLMTAEVVKWNYEHAIETGRLECAEFIEEIEVVDDYTLVFHLRDWQNDLALRYTYVQIVSKEAFDKHGVDYLRLHPVGTGPFVLEEFSRDVCLKWVKFDDYWREGYPYLDRVEVKFIPESTIIKTMLEAGEADMWNGPSVGEQLEMVEKGFVRQSGWAGMQWHLVPNTVDPDSPFADKRVREAVEYALDKKTLAETLGYGYWEPMHTVAAPGDWGGDRVFREYNPDKAKELLREAGYAEGPEIELLAMGSGARNELAEAIQKYLEDVGFKVKLDIADAGRYFSSVWQHGWKDLTLTFSGNHVNQSFVIQIWWGHEPGMNLVSFNRTPELVEMSKRAVKLVDEADQKASAEEIVYYIAEEALVIPLYHDPSAFIHNGKVHTTYFKMGLQRWDHHDIWLEP